MVWLRPIRSVCIREDREFSDPIGGFGLRFGEDSATIQMHRMSSHLCSLLQFFSIGLAHFSEQKLYSQNNMDKPPNHLAIVHNRIVFLIDFITLQMS